MRLFLSFLVLAFLGLVQALSSSGSRLLIVLEEAADKALFSKFWADLEGRLVSCNKESWTACADEVYLQTEASSSHLSRQRMTNYHCSDIGSWPTTTSFLHHRSLRVSPTYRSSKMQADNALRLRPISHPEAPPRLHQCGWQRPSRSFGRLLNP
jgi:hypothetical protein